MSGGGAGPAEARAPEWIDPGVSRSRIIVALLVTLLISKLPEIVLQDVLGYDLPWVAGLTLGATGVLWVVSHFFGVLRPLERFLAVMIVVGVALASLELITGSDAWAALVPASTQPMIALLASRSLMLVVALVVLGATLALGATRQEASLAVGDLDAPTRNRRKDGTYTRWRRFGPIAVVGLMLLMVWFTVPLLPDRVDLVAALPFIGIGAIAALFNAFWEEAAYRAAPLAMLRRAVGPEAGILILAVWFGLGHYYGGVPDGPMGAVASGALAVLFGRAMIETRGLGWPVVLHFAGDLVIFTFMAIASVA
jgi:membrane protease YdiL (CAAX protease family)